MKTSLSVCFAIVASVSLALAQDSITYEAYLGAEDPKKANEKWDAAVAYHQAAFDKNQSDNQLRWNLALAQFGYLNGTMRTRDEERFDRFYDITEKHLQALTKSDKYKGEAKALLSGLYGLKMGYSPMMGMVLGSKSSNLIADALKLSPDSPIVWKLEANSKLYTPSMFGGDKAEAVKAFEKSVALFEKDPAAHNQNWMYLDALTFLGQAYSATGQTAKAIETYEKVVKLESNAVWVKYNLLPTAKQKALGK